MQPQQELASALSKLSLANLSRRSSRGLRHELVPAPASIDRPGRRSPTGSLLPFRAPRQPTVLGVPLPHGFDSVLIVGGPHRLPKLFLLDPVAASWGTVGANDVARD